MESTPKTFALTTLGCKVNQEEGAALAGVFAGAGYESVDFCEPADIYIINTCTVTHLADRKSRQLIRRAHKQNPDAMLIVCGCYAQGAPQEAAALPGVDIVAGVNERAGLLALVEARLSQREATPLLAVADLKEQRDFVSIGAGRGGQKRARAYLKIEDGCDQFCRYCIVPQVRGPVRSLPLPRVLARAQELIFAGHREIVLSGIHIGAYGRDLASGIDLADAIKAILALPNLGRLRLSSLEPQHFTAKLLALLKDQPRLCPHFHIPLQAGCDKTLKAMGRRYNLSQYRAVVADLRRILPDPAITTDLIVGYPGESEEDFSQTLDFTRSLAFAGLHIFPYSPRPGAPAASLPDQVKPKDKQRRTEELTKIGKICQENYGKKYLGQELWVLAEQQVEQAGQIYWSGHSANYLQVLWPSGEIGKGEFQVVRGKEYRDGCIFAE